MCTAVHYHKGGKTGLMVICCGHTGCVYRWVTSRRGKPVTKGPMRRVTSNGPRCQPSRTRGRQPYASTLPAEVIAKTVIKPSFWHSGAPHIPAAKVRRGTRPMAFRRRSNSRALHRSQRLRISANCGRCLRRPSNSQRLHRPLRLSMYGCARR